MGRDPLSAPVIAAMLSGFPASSGVDPDMQIRAYLMAIDGIAHEAIARAARLFISGKVKDQNREFAPSCASFAEQCRTQEATIKAEAAPRIEAQPEPDRGPPVSPEKLKLLQRTLRGDRSAAAQLAAIYPHLDIVAPEQEQQP